MIPCNLCIEYTSGGAQNLNGVDVLYFDKKTAAAAEATISEWTVPRTHARWVSMSYIRCFDSLFGMIDVSRQQFGVCWRTHVAADIHCAPHMVSLQFAIGCGRGHSCVRLSDEQQEWLKLQQHFVCRTRLCNVKDLCHPTREPSADPPQKWQEVMRREAAAASRIQRPKQTSSMEHSGCSIANETHQNGYRSIEYHSDDGEYVAMSHVPIRATRCCVILLIYVGLSIQKAWINAYL